MKYLIVVLSFILVLCFSYSPQTKAVVSEEKPVSLILNLRLNGEPIRFRVYGHIVRDLAEPEVEDIKLISR